MKKFTVVFNEGCLASTHHVEGDSISQIIDTQFSGGGEVVFATEGWVENILECNLDEWISDGLMDKIYQIRGRVEYLPTYGKFVRWADAYGVDKNTPKLESVPAYLCWELENAIVLTLKKQGAKENVWGLSKRFAIATNGNNFYLVGAALSPDQQKTVKEILK